MNRNMLLLFALIALAISIAFFAWVYNIPVWSQQRGSAYSGSNNVGKVVLNVVGTPTPSSNPQVEQICSMLDPAYQQSCISALSSQDQDYSAFTQQDACLALPENMTQGCLDSLNSAG